MLNVTHLTQEVNADGRLILCFDVSKDRLDGKGPTPALSAR